MPANNNDQKTPSNKNVEWIKKDGYDTFMLANSRDLDVKGNVVQLVHFHEGKYNHYHKKTTEFFYFLAGNGRVVINDEEVILKAGVSVLVKPETKHTFINESDVPLEAIIFKTNNKDNDTFTD